MTAIRRHPTATSYSVAYQRDLLAAKAEILLALRYGTLPIERLVWQARTAYQRAWAAERERGGLAWAPRREDRPRDIAELLGNGVANRQLAYDLAEAHWSEQQRRAQAC